MNLRKIIFAIVFVLVINSVVAEEFPQAGITPDSFLYNLERIWERIQLRLTFNPTNRVRLRLLFAEERMLELDEMIRREKLEFVENLLKDKEGELDEADVEIEKLKIAGIDTTSLLEHLSNMTYKHVEVLERVLERVPESARPAIEKAINASSTRCIKTIRKMKIENPIRSTKLVQEFAEMEMRRINESIERRRTEEMRVRLERYKEFANETDEGVKRIEALKGNATAIAEHVCNMTYKHVEVLERVLERVPESARPAIEKAINLSVARHENCIERLLEKINKTIENVRKFNCTINTDCMRLLCPMVIGYDTPLCEDGKCTCGPKWKIANVTRWRERFQEEIRARIEEKIRIGYGK